MWLSSRVHTWNSVILDLFKWSQFAGYTNLFYSHKSIYQLFTKSERRAKKPGDWFKRNKLSLNNKKTTYKLFHQKFNEDDLPLNLPVLKIGSNQVQRKKIITFLGVMLDENLDWQEHILTIEKKKEKKAKNIGLLYPAKYLLNKSSLRCIYFGYIHYYLNYINTVWGSTYQTKLKSIHLL